MNTLAGQRVVVFGMGLSGRAAARLALTLGAQVHGVDSRAALQPIDGVTLHSGEPDRTLFTQADVVVVSPGIAARHPAVVAAQQAGVDVVGELAFAARYATVPIIGITGTNGKSTVTWFTHQLLEACGISTFVGGNLGRAVSEAVGSDAAVWVLEVSSYQLELAAGFRPAIGVVLNLTPDHLARHGDMRGYARAKTDLFQAMTQADVAMVPVDNALLIEQADRYPRPRRAWMGRSPGVVRDADQVVIALDDATHSLDLSALQPLGEHNRDNAAVAACLAIAIGAAPQAVQAAIGSLRGLPHRMEVVSDTDGVLVINDSKATNLDAARTGLVALDRPAVVLLGGQSKGPGFAALAPLLAPQRAVVCFGGDGQAISDELVAAGIRTTVVSTMDEALTTGLSLAQPGDAVLLSPGCASFDAYDNFAQRGDVFRTLAQARSPIGEVS